LNLCVSHSSGNIKTHNTRLIHFNIDMLHQTAITEVLFFSLCTATVNSIPAEFNTSTTLPITVLDDDTDLKACSILKVYSNTKCDGDAYAEYSHRAAHTASSGCVGLWNQIYHSSYCTAEGLQETYFFSENCEGESEDLVFYPNGCMSDRKSGRSFLHVCAMEECDLGKVEETRMKEEEYTEVAQAFIDNCATEQCDEEEVSVTEYEEMKDEPSRIYVRGGMKPMKQDNIKIDSLDKMKYPHSEMLRAVSI